MRKLIVSTVCTMFLFYITSCNKDEYGKDRDELLSDIELTEIEQLKGFAYWGKIWKMESIEYEGIEYEANLKTEFGLDSAVVIPVLKTNYFDGSDTIEIDSIYHTMSNGSIHFYEDNYDGNREQRIGLNFKIFTYQLQEVFEYGYLKYEIINTFPEMNGFWNYNSSTKQLTLKNVNAFFPEEFEFEGNVYPNEQPDTIYDNIVIQILELSGDNLKFEWIDPALEVEYTVNMRELQPDEQL